MEADYRPLLDLPSEYPSELPSTIRNVLSVPAQTTTQDGLPALNEYVGLPYGISKDEVLRIFVDSTMTMNWIWSIRMAARYRTRTRTTCA